jgi:hypothetical protein
MTQTHASTTPAFATWLRRRPTLPLALAVFAAAAACSGTTDLVARFDNLAYQPALYALNGSPIGAPTAVNTVFAATVRPDATFDFDVAFDLDAQGRAIVYAQRRLGHPAGGAGRQVALQPVDEQFDALERAPETQWVVDSLLTVEVGDVFVVRVVASICQFDLSPYVFSKIVVDSVDVPNRRLWASALTNPNCGFRSLQPGRPRN